MTYLKTPSLTAPLLKLRDVARQLGADIRVDVEKEGDSPCPFDSALSLRFASTEIILNARWCGIQALEDETVGSIIHELGHLLVARNTFSPEFEFLGWEFLLAEYCGLLGPWYLHMQNYGVPFFQEFGSLSPDQQSELLEERVYHAKERGLLKPLLQAFEALS